MKKILPSALAILFFQATVINAQIPTLTWIKKFGGKYDDRVHDVHIDAQKNLIVLGEFKDTCDFNPGAPVFSLVTTVNGGFVQKLDSNGNFIWAKKLDGNNYTWPYSSKTDASGNIYITGAFSGTSDFDPGPGTFTMSSNSAVPMGDAFVMKLTSSGNFVWAKSFGGNGTDCGANLTIDNGGNVYIDGSFQDVVDFDPGPGTYTLASNTTSASVSSQCFLMKLDNNGNFVWAGGISGPDKNGISNHIQDATGNIYVAGNYQGVSDFDFSAGTFTLNGFTQSSAFLAKYSSAGALIWVKGSTYASGCNAECKDVALDHLGFVYGAGVGGLTVNFVIGSSTVNAPGGTNNAFIVKFDTAGNYQWLKGFGTNGAADYVQSIYTDLNNNLYIAGNFPPGTGNDFDPDPVNTYTVSHSPVNALENWLMKTDNNGVLAWVITNPMTTPTITQQSVIMAGSVMDNSGNIYNFGGFNGPTDWDPSPSSFTITTLTNQPWDTDCFVQKLAQNMVMTGTSSESYGRYSQLIFPNPAQNYLTVKSDEKILAIQIMDAAGKIVMTENAGTNSIHTDISSLPQGIYLVKIQGEKNVEVKKLVKN